jgi:hypothetical protein
MVLVTSLLTGLFTAMLRSLFAVIAVAFLISFTFAAAFVLYGASVVSLVLSIVGFNAGLLLFAGAHFFSSDAHSTH